MPALANPRHETFARELAKGTPQTEAYKEAGFRSNAPGPNASKLANSASVNNRVQEIIGLANAITVFEKTNILPVVTLEWTIEQARRVAAAIITDVVTWTTRKYRDGNVKQTLKLVPVNKIPEATLAAIAEIKQSKDGSLTVKMHDKMAAIDRLLRHKGAYKENTDLTTVTMDLASLIRESYKPKADEPATIEGESVRVGGEAGETTIPLETDE